MKFLRALFVPLLAVVFVFIAAGVYCPVTTAQKDRAHSKKPAEFYYVCPMHEDVTSKTRGKKCPKCKMKLVRKPLPPPKVDQ